MPVYEYTALDIKGKSVSGIIDAEGSVAARHKLRASGNFPVSITEVKDTPSKKTPSSLSQLSLFNRIKPAEIAMLTRQLATLVGAGFPLVNAIDTLIPQTKAPAFKKLLARVKESVVEGNSFAGALALYPNAFTPLFINMVRAGESSGTLEIVLERLAEIMEKQQALKNRIRSALAYPALMSIVGAAVLFILLAYIVPSITTIFTDMDQVLPAPTRFLIAVGELFKHYWWIVLIVLVALPLAFRSFKKTAKGRYLYDKTILTLPYVGPLLSKLAVARFARTLGSLLENGVSMLSALEIVKNIVGNTLIAETIDAAAVDVGKGQGLGQALSQTDVLPYLSIQMIQVGEQSGELEPMLNKIADVFENEFESSIMSMTALLEPVMILVMAVAVGFIVLSICLPIFEMNQLIK
jgi:general secretion pathway protein F